MKFLPVVMIVLSGALYHACQKGLTRAQNPFVVLAAAYFVAFLAMLVPAILSRAPGSEAPSLTGTIGLGLACVGIELGVLLAYRLGWKVSLLSTYTSVGACVVLALVGYFVFREKLEPRALLGLLMAAAGLGLANLK